MGNVERSECMSCDSEPFDDEAEDAVRYHVQGVKRSVRLILYYSYYCERQEHGVEDELRLTRGPSDGVRMYERDYQSFAAPGDQAVHARAGKREQERHRHQIENVPHIALEYLRAEEIKKRHEEHGAEQAHSSIVNLTRRFKKREELYRRNAEHYMQYGY